jgi:hypothetical protein
MERPLHRGSCGGGASIKRVLAGIALLLGIGATSALAHHPFDAEFDWKRPVTINGTVTKFEWREPHSMVEIKGKDEKGTEGQWTVELGGMSELNRSGWNRNQLKVGEQVRVDGWMAKDGSKKVSAKSVTPSNGREMFAGSSFFDMARAGAATAGTRGREQAAPTTGNEPAPKPQR